MTRCCTLLGTLWIISLMTGCALLPAPTPPRDAQRHVQALTKDIRDQLQSREITREFALYEAYSADRLDASAGTNTYSDKTGNCRLNWFDYLLRHPIESISEAEAFTWQLNQDAKSTSDGVARIVATASDKLDVDSPAVIPAPSAMPPSEALPFLASTIIATHQALAATYAPLTSAERDELETLLFQQSTGEASVGHRFADKETGRRVCDLLERTDRKALMEAARHLALLTDDAYSAALSQLPAPNAQRIPGVTGVVESRQLPGTSGRRILISGRGDNHYDLEALTDVCAIIDLGGNDTYVEGNVGFDRPLLTIIDLGGDDTFTGKLPGIQGGAILGASLLINRGGNDRYQATDVAQGSALAGIGILIDDDGDDHYIGRRRVQGQAVAGFGLLLDRDGNDSYRAALLAQGAGGPLGFGLLVDQAGADTYYAGGLYSGNYSDSPGYGAWSQGVGVGPRGSANGGIGVLLDGGGDDLYEYDYFSHGGGYWFAAGFARDFGGNDQRIGSTRTQFDGSPREVKPFVRWGVGYGCHYALGFLIDDQGDDTYVANTAAVAFVWDIGVGALLDFGGNDLYQGGAGAGHASNAGLAVLQDVAGNDRYTSRSLGHARAEMAYHPIEKAGGNFAFLIDGGGDDDFGTAGKNNEEAAHGWAGGVFISRPGPIADQ